MNWLGAVGIGLGIGLMLTMIVAQCRTGKPIRGFLKSGTQGVCALAAVDIIGVFTGVSVGLNLFTGMVSLLLGLPGVVAILFLNVIFI